MKVTAFLISLVLFVNGLAISIEHIVVFFAGKSFDPARSIEGALSFGFAGIIFAILTKKGK